MSIDGGLQATNSHALVCYHLIEFDRSAEQTFLAKTIDICQFNGRIKCDNN